MIKNHTKTGPPAPGRKSKAGDQGSEAPSGSSSPIVEESQGHLSGAPRTVNPRHSAQPSDVINPRRVPRSRRVGGVNSSNSAETEEPGLRDNATPQHRGQKKWSDEEVATLAELCKVYEGKNIIWNKVAVEFHRLHTPRSKGSLSAKWAAIRKIVVAAPAQPRVLPQLEEELGEGTDTPEDPIETPEAEESEETAEGGINLELTEADRDNQPPEIDLEDPAYRAFRKAFHGYFRWAVNSFDREPVKRIGRNCPKLLFAYADKCIREMIDARGPNQSEIGRLNAAVYAAGRTIYQFWKDEANERRQAEQDWFRRTGKDQKSLKELISAMTAELQRRRVKRKPTAAERRAIHWVASEVGTRSTRGIVARLEQSKQRLKLLEDRISLREQERRRKQLRKRFAETPSMKVLVEERDDSHGERPTMRSVLKYWRPIIGKRAPADPEKVEVLRKWREEQLNSYTANLRLDEAELLSEYGSEVRRVRPWKACGPDGIHAFWWKSIPVARKLLGKLVAKWLLTGKVTTGWLCRGRTILIPKKGDLRHPENYRPITCLNTCYKVLTAVINRLLSKHLGRGGAIPANQRALRCREWGCTHALLLDRAIAMDAMAQKKKALSVAWLDFRKAFDSVSHEYLRWVLESVRTPPTILLTLKRLMSDWCTRFELRIPGKRRVARSAKMAVLNGIFQGDALSPNLFVLCVAPISYALTKGVAPCRSAAGRLAGHDFEISNQFYVDDLKLYARTPAQLHEQLRIVEEVSQAMGLHLNAGKCAEAHYDPMMKADTVENAEEATVEKLKILGINNTYKYLGIEQRLLTAENATKEYEVRFMARTQVIFASELTWSQMVSAYNTLAIAVLRYAFMHTGGGTKKLDSALHYAGTLDTAVRDLLRTNKCRFKNSCVDRLYIPRELGGCGLPSIEDLMQDSIIATWCYLALQADLKGQYWMFDKLAKRGKRTPVADATKVLKNFEVGMEVDIEGRTVTVDGNVYRDPTKLNRYLHAKLSQLRAEVRVQSWKAMSMAGRFINSKYIDHHLSSLWLVKGMLSARNLRDTLAVQEGALLTRCCPATRGNGNHLCRCCHKAPETSEHITSGCSKWLPNLYVARHNSVARNIYYTLCSRYGLTPVHYSNQVSPVSENDRCKVLWDTEIQTRAPLKHRKPDIVVFDKEKNAIIVLEVSVAHAAGLQNQRNIKINRYTVNSTELTNETQVPYSPGANLLADMQDVYRQQVEFVPVVVGTCGEHLPVLKDDLQRVLKLKVPEVEDLLERLSRSAAIGTARIVRAHLACV